MSSKQALREQYLNERKNISRHQIIDASLAIMGYLKPLLKGHVVGLYVPIQNEIDLTLLLRDDVAIPAIEQGQLVFRKYVEPLIPGPFGTLESQGEICTPTLLIVPGIAFSHMGVRLGYGKGYYDDYLTNTMCKIGVCLDSFFVESLPMEPHDVVMNAVITPSGMKEITPCIR